MALTPPQTMLVWALSGDLWFGRRELLLQAYKPKDGSDPMRIVYTIVIHGPMAKPFVDDLIVLLKHENPEVRRAAAWGVPRMFADDKPVIAALREALGDAETAEEAARSLKMLEEARK